MDQTGVALSTFARPIWQYAVLNGYSAADHSALLARGSHQLEQFQTIFLHLCSDLDAPHHAVAAPQMETGHDSCHYGLLLYDSRILVLIKSFAACLLTEYGRLRRRFPRLDSIHFPYLYQII